MSAAQNRLLDALRTAGCTVRGTGKQASAQCPAHEDHNPSLSVTAHPDRVLLHCHSGCTTDDVLTALGLQPRDLFDNPRGPRYDYLDGLGQVVRTVHRSPDKRFRQSGITGGPTLYRLPQVVEAVKAGTTVHLVEGESDVLSVELAGGVGTTAPQGAINVGKCDLSPLHGAQVVAVVDRDAAGQKWAAAVTEALNGHAASLTFVHAAIGKDLTDHYSAGHGLDALVPLDVEPATGDYLDVITASDVTIRRVRYLWDRRIPLGAATLMPGEEGIGKTTVGVRIMADLTRGTLPGEFHGCPQDAIVLATEDGLEDVFVPRLREAGADLTRVHIIRASIALDGDNRQVIVPRDLAAIALAVRQWDAALVWIDSLVTTLPDEMKSISYKDTAKVLKALGDWAEAERVAVVAPWHLNKTSGSDTALRIMDSRAFRTAVRSMLLVVPDPDAPEGETVGIVALDKANAGTLHVPALRYRLRSAPYLVHEVDTDTGEVRELPASCGVADWTGEVDGDGRQVARDALIPAIEKAGTPAQWLREYLTAEGESSRVDVIAAAREDGISESALKRAARRVGVHSRDETGQDDKGRPYRRSVWSLPQSGHQSVHPYPTDPTGPTGETTTDPTDPISAGQPQSVQSGQSGPRHRSDPTGKRSDPTGTRPRFTPPSGPGRCTGCGHHIETQGHAAGCPDRSTA